MFLADDADGADLPVLLVIFKQKPEKPFLMFVAPSELLC